MRILRMALVGWSALVLIAAAAVADSPEQKRIRDQNGTGGGYTTERLDRDGGENCTDAPTIGVASYNDTGNTSGYADDWGPDVGGYGQDGEDQAYLIVITMAGNIDVTVTPNDTGFDLSSYIISDSDCSNYSPAVLAGADSGFSGDPEVFSYSASPGTYVIIVDSFLPGEVGPFTIDVTSNVPVELTSFTID